jgi:methionyl-tRNA formyltransferase
MKSEPKVGLYLMSAKGHAVLECLLARFGPGFIRHVVTARDKTVAQDYHDDIVKLARSAGLRVFTRPEAPPPGAAAPCLFAISWRWLIHTAPSQQLIVFHDSILPRYRGFAPLVSALVNGDRRLGVTALVASAEYDRGPIVAQSTVPISYPLKLAQAIDAVNGCYRKLAVEVGGKLLQGGLKSRAQVEARATYSLWRDEHDYFVDWSWDAARLRRFVDAVGFPFLGAATAAHGKVYRVIEASALPDVKVENRTPGKVIFIRDGQPVVVCGKGLLQIHQLIDAESRQDALPLKSFRTCFHTPPRV